MSRWKQILVIICGLLALSVLLAACGGASDGGSNYPERSRPTAAPAAPLAPAATAAPLAPPPLAPSSRTEVGDGCEGDRPVSHGIFGPPDRRELGA